MTEQITCRVLTGPTASGKTELGVRLAKAEGWEILCMDSMQIYRRMNIGTAKPTSDEMQGIPHHLMDICEPGKIDKTRYLVPCGKHTFEVDEFYGENEGLVMAEVELESENEAYEKPDFIGIEVTGDRRYYNSCLLKNPFTSWDENTKTTPQEQQQG